MRFMALTVALASWLMVSTFAFSQSGTSFLLAWITALVVSAVSMASPGRIWLRFVITAMAFVLFWCALLLPDISIAARVSNALVGLGLFALSVIPTPAREKSVGAG
jgi:hypothetical protein